MVKQTNPKMLNKPKNALKRVKVPRFLRCAPHPTHHTNPQLVKVLLNENTGKPYSPDGGNQITTM